MESAVSMQSGRGVLALMAVLAAAAGVLLLAAGLPLHGIALAGVILLPYALYIALVRPLAFPFGLYVLLVPLDNILSAGSFGTLTKLLGIVSGTFLLLWILRRGTHAVPASPLLPLAVLILWMFMSGFWAVDQGAALAVIPTYAGLMMLYVALTFTPLTIRDFYSVITSVVLGGIVAAAYGATVFFQHPTQAQLDTGRLIIQVGENIIDPNHFANALLFPAAVLGMWSLRTPRTYAKLFGIGGVGLILAAILYSGSREALIGFGAIVLYYLWRSRYRLQVLVATLGALIASFSIQTTIWSRFSTAMLTGGSGRSSIWAVAWEAAKHRPLQGYGIGNFQQAYDMFYLAVQQPYPYGWSSPAHNIVFHYAVELGVVGLALIVWFYCRVFRSLRIVERDSPLYDYRIMLEGALVAIAAVSFSVDLFTYKYAWLVISAAALFCNAVAGQVQSEEIRSQSSAMMEARPLRS